MEQFNAQNMVSVYNAKGKKTGQITAGEAYINRLAEMGVFEGTDPSQIDHIKALAKKGQVKEQDVQKITGGNLSALIQLTTSEMSEPEYMRGIVRGLGKQNPLSAMQILNQTSGINVNASQFLTAWNYRNKDLSETYIALSFQSVTARLVEPSERISLLLAPRTNSIFHSIPFITNIFTSKKRNHQPNISQ